MPRHAHLDPVGGIAGDMFIAAMLDAYPENQPACWHDLQTAGLFEHVDVELAHGKTQGLAAKKFQVSLRKNPAKRTGRYADIRQWLSESELDFQIRQRALSILHLLAIAEAHVHGVAVEDVHFHEIADWDSLVDVVAAASLIERSGIDAWSCAPLPLGSGLVQTEHGALPVPAPATLHLLTGFSVWDDGDAGERVTPTGAAILKHLFTQDDGSLMPVNQRKAGQVRTVGCGAGQRRLATRPNLLRLVVTEPLQPLGSSGVIRDEILELSCDIDDMTPEELAVSLEYVRASEGVLDAGFRFGVGKKGRAVFHVVVLCLPTCEASVVACLFRETTTLGMRVNTTGRRILARESCTLSDAAGDAGVKVADRLGGRTGKVESDDLAAQPGLQARRLRAQQLLAQVET